MYAQKENLPRGHIKNAKLIPVSDLSGRLKEIEGWRDKDLLVYCQSGMRSAQAARILV